MDGGRLFRIEPKLPVTAMQTYAVSAPAATHWREATCREVDCPMHLNGWQTLVDERTALGRAQAGYIRHKSVRSFSEARDAAGLTVFTFPAGQTCFRQHRVRVEREEIFIKFPGDHRGRTGEARVLRPQDWVDDFAEHQEKLADRLERG